MSIPFNIIYLILIGGFFSFPVFVHKVRKSFGFVVIDNIVEVFAFVAVF